ESGNRGSSAGWLRTDSSGKPITRAVTPSITSPVLTTSTTTEACSPGSTSSSWVLVVTCTSGLPALGRGRVAGAGQSLGEGFDALDPRRALLERQAVERGRDDEFETGPKAAADPVPDILDAGVVVQRQLQLHGRFE